MVRQALDKTTDLTVDLLEHYVFDLGSYTASQLIERWLKDYSAAWIRFAVVEALYRGRYKAVSVEQILAFWQRRGQVLYHFNHEFERLVCGNFPQAARQSELNTNGSPSVLQRVTAVVAVSPSTHPSAEHQPRLSRSENPYPIEQFIPDTEYSSDFHSKLKAIAQSSEG